MMLPKESITPALKKRIEEVEKACCEGRCVTCRSKEELNAFLDSLDDAVVMAETDAESIRRGLEDVKTGKVYEMDSSESLESFLDRMEHI